MTSNLGSVAPGRRLDQLPRDLRKPILAVGAIAALGAISAIVAVASRTDRQLEVLAIAAALLAFMVSLRWPMLPLFAFVFLIPLEEAVVIQGVGTLSRYAAIMFVVTYGIPRIGRLTIRSMPVAGWGYVAWAVFSATWALDAGAAWTEVPILILLFSVAVLIATVTVDRPAIVRPLLWTYSLAAASTALVGVVLSVVSGGPTGPEDRIAAIQDQNPAYYAAILLPALVFVLSELLNGRHVFLSGSIAFLCTIAIVVSGTRGAWLSAVVVFMLFLLPRLTQTRRIAAILVAAMLLLATLQVPGVATLVGERADLALSSGGSGRTDIWSVGIRIFESSPVQGVGLSNFPIAFTPDLVRETPVEITNPATLLNRAPHNIVIGTLGELGVIGLALLVMFLVPISLRRGWGPDANAVQAGLASLLILALFLDVLNRKEVWLFVGFACGLSYLADAERVRAARRAIRRPVTDQPLPAITAAPGPSGNR